MEETLKSWVEQWGYGAVVPVLLLDSSGVPWPWVLLLLLAEEANRSVPLMLGLGFLTLTVWDHALYLIGAQGGPRLLRRLSERIPAIGDAATEAAMAVRKRGFITLVAGRFLPFIGRLIGLGAGLAGMSYARFALLDAIGVGITTIGFGWGAHLIGRRLVDEPWFEKGLTVAMWAILIIAALWLGRQLLMWMHARDARRREEQHDAALGEGG